MTTTIPAVAVDLASEVTGSGSLSCFSAAADITTATTTAQMVLTTAASGSSSFSSAAAAVETTASSAKPVLFSGRGIPRPIFIE